MSEPESVTTGAEPVVLTVNPDVCIGMGECEILEPEVFLMDDDAISQIIGDASFPADRARKIMLACPSSAIIEA